MAAPLAPVNPYTSAQHFFGAELRRLRMRAGLSQRALADLIHVHPTMIGKVETAQRFLDPALAARCDDILNTDGALTRLHGLVTTERATPAPPPVVISDPAEVLAHLVTAAATLMFSGQAPVKALLERIDGVLGTPGPQRRDQRHASAEVVRRQG